MGFRYLTEVSASELSKSNHAFLPDSSIEVKPITYDEFSQKEFLLEDIQGPAKFHIGMLTISLLAGLGYGGYVTYNCWRGKNVFLSHIRNLVIALTCRTFFSILFDGVIILNSPLNVEGGNALLSFECICLNLVMAFWLIFTIYIHARVQRNFNSEPSLKLYMFGVPGVAIYFSLVWIFAMEGTYSSQVWWFNIFFISFFQWVVNSIRLLYLLIQLALVIDVGRMMMVKSSDNDSISLLRKIAIMMLILILLFWLQFGLSVGRPPLSNPQPYLYFYYLIDGTQCVFVCVVLFFFNMWVPMILDKLPNIIMESGKMIRTSRLNDEVLIRGDGSRGLVTIDSLFMTQESERWKNAKTDERGDVVYSSVVQPQNLQKTIDLYKRLNVIPANKATVVQGEKFYDCDFQSDFRRSDSLILNNIRNLESNKNFKVKNKINEKVVKKNAFYSSKYLVIDPKEKDFPKYLETRPCAIQAEGEASKNEDLGRGPFTSLERLGADELVEKWLIDHSDDMENGRQKRKSFQQASIEKHKKVEKKVEAFQNTSNLLEQHRPRLSETIVSTVDSIIIETLFSPKKKISLGFEGNPEILNANSDSNNTKEISQISEAPSRKYSDPDGSILNDQIRIETKEEEDDSKVTEKQSIKYLNIFEENQGPIQENKRHNFEFTEGISEEKRMQNEISSFSMAKTPEQHIEEQKITAKETNEILNNVKHVGKIHISKEPENLNSECDSNPLESALTEMIPSQKKKILPPTKNFHINNEKEVRKDEAKSSLNRSETEMDIEKFQKILEENIPNKDSDLKKPQNTEGLLSSINTGEENLKNTTSEESKANGGYLTYSDLVDFRSKREKLDKEIQGESGSEFNLLEAISSTFRGAISFSGSFFGLKSEDSQFKRN